MTLARETLHGVKPSTGALPPQPPTRLRAMRDDLALPAKGDAGQDLDLRCEPDGSIDCH
jgi:hypothetical protein